MVKRSGTYIGDVAFGLVVVMILVMMFRYIVEGIGIHSQMWLSVVSFAHGVVFLCLMYWLRDEVKSGMCMGICVVGFTMGALYVVYRDHPGPIPIPWWIVGFIFPFVCAALAGLFLKFRYEDR